MKIVKFKNGTYGIRRWFFGYYFKDLCDDYWWRLNSRWLKDCRGTKEEVLKVFNRNNDYGEPCDI